MKEGERGAGCAIIDGLMRYGPTYSLERRFAFGIVGLLLLGLLIVARLFQLQVLDAHAYQVLASDQHVLQAALIPKRGGLYVRDRATGELHPLAKDRYVWQVRVVPREIRDPASLAKDLAPLLVLPEADVLAKLSATSTSTLLAKDVPLETIDALREKNWRGIAMSKMLMRWYPEKGVGGQVLGFVATDDHHERVGRYGLEGYFQKSLAGEAGSIVTEKDAAGRRLTIGRTDLKQARDGNDIVLTIDRTIQYEACVKVEEAVRRFEAVGGSVVIMDPQTGAILAMCSTPDFDPAEVGKIPDVSVLNNPITFYQFEPGSIFKPVTLAAALDTEKITPYTTYQDVGQESIDGFTIRNSDKQAHGVQTMTEVLEKSLNTGTIFVQRLLGRDVFRDYVTRFGFGEKTGIELRSEVAGEIDALSRKGKVFAATASFGQGISVTPLQMVQAYAALGNGGKLMRPYLVQEVIHPDGSHEVTQPQVIREVISPRTSRLISAMLVNVVEHGHGKRAAVPGYYIAGKTGTAQIPDPHANGYLKDATVGSFAGYGPADHPAFVMLVKIDRPRTVQFAESSAGPIFGELAKFLLSYLHVPPDRSL